MDRAAVSSGVARRGRSSRTRECTPRPPTGSRRRSRRRPPNLRRSMGSKIARCGDLRLIAPERDEERLAWSSRLSKRSTEMKPLIASSSAAQRGGEVQVVLLARGLRRYPRRSRRSGSLFAASWPSLSRPGTRRCRARSDPGGRAVRSCACGNVGERYRLGAVAARRYHDSEPILVDQRGAGRAQRVASRRSAADGVPPRCRWPRIVTRDSSPVSCSSSCDSCSVLLTTPVDLADLGLGRFRSIDAFLAAPLHSLGAVDQRLCFLERRRLSRDIDLRTPRRC